MLEVKHYKKCPSCKEELIVLLREFGAVVDLKMKKKPAGFGEKMALINCYKDLKNLHRLTTWDGTYRGRALKAAGKILHVFRKLPDPVSVGIELIKSTKYKAEKQNWHSWTIETCASHAGQWLADKLEEKPKRQ